MGTRSVAVFTTISGAAQCTQVGLREMLVAGCKMRGHVDILDPATAHRLHRRGELRAARVMAERTLAHPSIRPLFHRTVAEILGPPAERAGG